MKFKSLIYLLILLLPTSIFSMEEIKKNSLIFGIDSFDNIFTSFDGGAISYKYDFNNNSSIRVGLNVSLDLEGTTSSGFENDEIDSSGTYESNTYSIEPNITYIRYLSDKKIKPFFGIGIFGNHTKSNYYRNVMYIDQEKTENSKSFTNKIGLTSAVGIEFKPIDYIGLILEYKLKYYYAYSEYNKTTVYEYDSSDEENQSTNEESDSFNIDYANIILGLAFYF